MIKPIWAIAGVALFGTVGVAGAVIVASSGGEEEVVSQEQETAGATPTASPQADPEGWVRFSHPGTAEAPPFSFAYPSEWHLQEPELIAVTLPKGEPLGTGVQVELFSYDPAIPPSHPPPGNWMHLEVFVGPFAPLEACGPDDGGEPSVLGGFDARRIVSPRAPASTSDAIIVYAVTSDDCYAFDSNFSIDGNWEDIFNRIVDSFRIGGEVPSPSETPSPISSPEPTPTEVATSAETPEPARSTTIFLESLSESGQSGTAIITESGDGLLVEISFSGDPPGARRPAQIRWSQPYNYCNYWQSGAVAYEINDLVDGRSVTRITKGYDEFALVPYVIVILESEQDRAIAATETTGATALACGTVKLALQ